MTRRALKPCGTPAAWRRHKRHDETPCPACRRAHADDVARYKKRTPIAPRQLRPCGEEASYQRHKRRGEDACDPCLKAHAEYEANRAARKKTAA